MTRSSRTYGRSELEGELVAHLLDIEHLRPKAEGQVFKWTPLMATGNIVEVSYAHYEVLYSIDGGDWQIAAVWTKGDWPVLGYAFINLKTGVACKTDNVEAVRFIMPEETERSIRTRRKINTIRQKFDELRSKRHHPPGEGPDFN